MAKEHFPVIDGKFEGHEKRIKRMVEIESQLEKKLERTIDLADQHGDKLKELEISLKDAIEMMQSVPEQQKNSMNEGTSSPTSHEGKGGKK